MQTLASVEQLEVRQQHVKPSRRRGASVVNSIDVTPSHPLHKKWCEATHSHYFPAWEKLFLQMLVEKYPHLVEKSLRTSRQGSWNGDNSIEALELEHVAWCWKLYMYCNDIPGCVCPRDIVAMFK